MKTYTIEPKEKLVDNKPVKVNEVDRHIEIHGDIYEEFRLSDLLIQIGLVEEQIKNIKKAKEDKPDEIASLFQEMEKYKDKIADVKSQFSLKIAIPKLKTENDIMSYDSMGTGTILGKKLVE